MPGRNSATDLESYLHERIPVSGLMKIRVEECQRGRLVLVAPLSVNHNHLGTAFGGSLATVATLAGYAALWTALGDREAHVVVKRSEIDYIQPVREEIRAVCEIAGDGTMDEFRRTFAIRGKARLTLTVSIVENGETCVHYRGEFVALK